MHSINMFKNLARNLMLTASLLLPFHQAWAGKKKDGQATEATPEKKKKKKKKQRPEATESADTSIDTPETVIASEILPPDKETIDPCTLSLMPQPNPERWTALDERDQFAALLLMIGSSFTPRFVGKYLFEKGEFSLGIPLEGNRTLDLNYILDARFGKGILILSAINVVDAFGHVTTVLSKPLDPLTGQLRPIKQTDMLSQAEYDQLVFPITVTGSLLEKLMKSKTWLENVNADEIRDRAAGDIIRLKGIGHARWLRTFLFRDMLKYTFRFAVFAAILVSLGVVQVHTGKGSLTRALYETFSGDQVVSAQPDVTPQQRAAGAIADISASQIIDTDEKSWLTSDLQAHPEKASGESVKVQEFDFRMLASDVPGRNWIYFPSGGKLYLTTDDTTFSNKKDLTKFGNLIEIPAGQMPKSYAAVTALFNSQPAVVGFEAQPAAN